MATDSPNSSNNIMASLYLKNPSSSSYPEASNLPSNMTMYMNFSSSTQSYSDTLAENSHSRQNFIEIPSMGTSESTLTRQETLSNPFNSHLREQAYGIQKDGGNEMLFVQPMGGTIRNSKYLEAAQELLDEVVNVRKALKKPDSENHQSFHGNGLKSFKETDEKSKSGSILPHMNGVPSNTQDSTVNLSPAERHDIQNKLTKLLSMLDEVDKRYRQYHHQMQIVISSFDMIAGCGAAKPYTALAFQTISRHFRGLRDAISGQIQETRRSLGEQDSSVNSKECGISRLRYVDQQLRQQKALQHLGMMQQHAWRPQRGLPESSVSILRAWLFEHFLHPYPKDSDKIMLARQAGLTRGQVSNWFINARVRLWKPMVEEMYKEEVADMEMESNSSSENAARDNTRTSKDGEIEFQQSINSTVRERNHPGQFHNSKSDPNPDEEMGGSMPGMGFQNEAHGENEINYGIMKMREDHRTNVNYSLFQNALVQPDHSSGERYMSLTLGLQHCDNGGIPVSVGTNHNFFTMREDEIYNTAASSVEPNTADYDYIDLGNQRYSFGSTRLLHDFVA